jgi:alpha-amylase/alpha-mannosidase (GH57 family)
MHQPDYRDPQTGVAELPWVRLHAASAYRDMALALRAEPHVRATVNFVPSLCAQLEANAPDAYELLARRPASQLDASEREMVVARFFSVHWGRQVEPRPRYKELLEKKRNKQAFSMRDLTDLEVLFHLAWVGFATRAEEPMLAELERKGAGFSEDEKIALLDLVRAQVARVLPEWRALAESGQVELVCSPFNHPIIPLLCDTDAALRAMPDARLPFRFAFPEDAREQIRRAQASHARVFGHPPKGMWPPEGSLSPEAVTLYGECGVKWLAGDENVLWGSLGGVQREQLAQPHRFAGVDLIFRDRDLSDRIGFAYANTSPDAATADLVRRAQAYAGGVCGVFLDGENAWESYEGRGGPFFRTLYRALVSTPGLRTRTISEALADRPAPKTLPRLHSGSWIDGRFAIWIGDPDKNRAWEALAAARRACAESKPALEQLYVAEGSDWFWWFGEPFHSAEDFIFDRLFRHRIAAAYRAAGLPVPTQVSSPIAHGAPKPALPPRRYVTPRLDGLVTSYFEWDGAGRWDVPRGAAMGESRTLLGSIHYAFDRKNMYVRLDPAGGHDDPLAGLRGSEIRLHLRTSNRQLMVRCDVDTVELPAIEQVAPEAKPLGKGVGFARVEIVELGVSFATLEVGPRERIELVVEIHNGGVSVARYPRDGYLQLDVPDENFEAENWSA